MTIRIMFTGFLLCLLGSLCASCCTFCDVFDSLSDNATSLGNGIEAGFYRLKEADVGAEQVVIYEPVLSGTKPYTLILLPGGPIEERDVEQEGKGLPWSETKRVFKELNYVGVRNGKFIIVLQDDRINFTRYGLHLAEAKTVLVHKGQGSSRLILRKEPDGVFVVGFK